MGRLNTVQVFLSHGIDVNLRDKDGCAALHYAAFGEKVSIIELLISRGADVNAIDNNRKSVLDWTDKNNSPDTVNLLLSHGATSNLTFIYSHNAEKEGKVKCACLI